MVGRTRTLVPLGLGLVDSSHLPLSLGSVVPTVKLELGVRWCCSHPAFASSPSGAIHCGYGADTYQCDGDLYFSR